MTVLTHDMVLCSGKIVVYWAHCYTIHLLHDLPQYLCFSHQPASETHIEEIKVLNPCVAEFFVYFSFI